MYTDISMTLFLNNPLQLHAASLILFQVICLYLLAHSLFTNLLRVLKILKNVFIW